MIIARQANATIKVLKSSRADSLIYSGVVESEGGEGG